MDDPLVPNGKEKESKGNGMNVLWVHYIYVMGCSGKAILCLWLYGLQVIHEVVAYLIMLCW